MCKTSFSPVFKGDFDLLHLESCVFVQTIIQTYYCDAASTCVYSNAATLLYVNELAR